MTTAHASVSEAPAAELTIEPRTAARSLHRYAVFFAAFVLLHIKGGAMVTSTGSGMAFTDWPLARGSLWPPDMNLGDYFEHLHRIWGALVGLGGIGLLIGVIRVDRRVWLARLCWALLAMISVQGLLGGLGVRLGEADGQTWWPAAVGHGVLAQPTLCVAVLVAFALSRNWTARIEVPAGQAAVARRFGALALVAVFVQLIAGAIVRHTDAVGMLWFHIGMAMVVSVVILLAAAYSGSRFGAAEPGFRAVSRWIYSLLALQITLGFVTLLVRSPKDASNIEYLGRSLVVSSHVIVGASLFLLSTLVVAKAWRNLIPVDDAPGRTA